MAKQSGLGDALYVHGYDLSGDVGEVSAIHAITNLLDMTGLDKSAHERISGLFDGEITFNHFFNKATGQEFAVLSPKAGTDRVVCYFKGGAIGNMAAALVAKQINYDFTRGTDGSLAGPSQHMANAYGLDYCEQLTAGKRTDTAATNGASLDGGAASALGAAAYLQVFAFTGTDATVKVQSSSDDAATDPFADVSGLTFTQITTSTPTAERKVTSLTASIEQYLRAVSVTSAGFTSLEFAVCLTRYPVDD